MNTQITTLTANTPHGEAKNTNQTLLLVLPVVDMGINFVYTAVSNASNVAGYTVFVKYTRRIVYIIILNKVKV